MGDSELNSAHFKKKILKIGFQFHGYQIQKIGNPEIGNTVVVGENPLQIRIQ